MNRLFSVLRAIFLARRLLSPKKVEYNHKPISEHIANDPPIETPPPQQEPLVDRYAIGCPIIDDFSEFFNIYAAEFADDVFYSRCEIYVPYIGEASIKSLGASRELQALQLFLKGKSPQEWLLRVFKVSGYFIVAANSLYSDTQLWYYCTQLELPEVRFNPAITFIHLSKEKKNNKKENELDCSHKYKGHK